MSGKKVTVLQVTEDGPIMDGVLRLADANWDTLGFIPAEALRGRARQGQVWAAVDAASAVLGYVWYSASRRTGIARIHHLCVDGQRRRAGVGRALADAVKSKSRHLHGIALSARRDYVESCAFWRRVGFVPVGERPGRGKDARELTCFWFDHGQPNLFSERRARLAASTLVAVLDANVFFDLTDEGSPSNKESRALLADWLRDYVSLWVTDELLNEINRRGDPDERKRQRQFFYSFDQIAPDDVRRQRTRGQVAELLPEPRSDSDRSDHEHLAAAAAAEADFFVTRDRELREHAPQIAEQLGVEVVTPAGLVLAVDEQQRKTEYNPRRLAGSDLVIQRVAAPNIAHVGGEFLNNAGGERRTEFERRLRELLSGVADSPGFLVRRNGRNAAFFISRRIGTHAIEIPIFRVQRDSLATTLTRHLLARVIREAAEERRSAVVLRDPGVSESVLAQCTHLGFVIAGQTAVKLSLRGVLRLDDIFRAVAREQDAHPELAPACAAVQRIIACCDNDEEWIDAIDRIEHLLWPLKVNDDRAISYRVPIKSRWAKALFDEHLACQDLWAPDASLLLQHENVYYRSAAPPAVQAPSRVLWYVTSDRDYDGTGQIRACSRLEEVVVGTATEVFKRFCRLGVYAWADVLAHAGGDPAGQVMALRFSDTYLLPAPIAMSEVDDVLISVRQVKPQYTTALRLRPVEFARLYARGAGEETRGQR